MMSPIFMSLGEASTVMITSPTCNAGVMLPLLIMLGRNPSMPVDPQIASTLIMATAIQPNVDDFLTLTSLPRFLM